MLSDGHIAKLVELWASRVPHRPAGLNALVTGIQFRTYLEGVPLFQLLTTDAQSLDDLQPYEIDDIVDIIDRLDHWGPLFIGAVASNLELTNELTAMLREWAEDHSPPYCVITDDTIFSLREYFLHAIPPFQYDEGIAVWGHRTLLPHLRLLLHECICQACPLLCDQTFQGCIRKVAQHFLDQAAQHFGIAEVSADEILERVLDTMRMSPNAVKLEHNELKRQAFHVLRMEIMMVIQRFALPSPSLSGAPPSLDEPE